MFKRLTVAVAALFVLATSAFAAGTVPGFSLVPQFDLTGKIAPGCRLYFIQAGTVSSPQNAYQDSGLTLLQPNPMTCDAAGRIGQWFVADGNIKLRLTDKNGVLIFTQDNLLVIGASSGGGGGGSVDPTTILATGDFKDVYNTGVLTGFVRCNGRTMGNATSGATERANADTSALFVFLWNADANLAVSGGRGASAAADYAANKTITLPDCRGRVLAGIDTMGNTAANRLTSTYFIGDSTTLGVSGGFESRTLLTANLPPYTPSGSVSVTSTTADFMRSTTGATDNYSSIGGICCFINQVRNAVTSTGSLTGTAQGGTSTPIPIVQPTILVTKYIKL